MKLFIPSVSRRIRCSAICIRFMVRSLSIASLRLQDRFARTRESASLLYPFYAPYVWSIDPSLNTEHRKIYHWAAREVGCWLSEEIGPRPMCTRTRLGQFPIGCAGSLPSVGNETAVWTMADPLWTRSAHSKTVDACSYSWGCGWRSVRVGQKEFPEGKFRAKLSIHRIPEAEADVIQGRGFTSLYCAFCRRTFMSTSTACMPRWPHEQFRSSYELPLQHEICYGGYLRVDDNVWSTVAWLTSRDIVLLPLVDPKLKVSVYVTKNSTRSWDEGGIDTNTDNHHKQQNLCIEEMPKVCDWWGHCVLFSWTPRTARTGVLCASVGSAAAETANKDWHYVNHDVLIASPTLRQIQNGLKCNKL